MGAARTHPHIGCVAQEKMKDVHFPRYLGWDAAFCREIRVHPYGLPIATVATKHHMWSTGPLFLHYHHPTLQNAVFDQLVLRIETEHWVILDLPTRVIFYMGMCD